MEIQRKNWQRHAVFLKSAEGALVANVGCRHRQKGALLPMRFLSSSLPRTRSRRVHVVRLVVRETRETREEHEIDQKS